MKPKKPLLSILIPTYNYDCTELVKRLQAMGERVPCAYEIWVADDASAEEWKERNRCIAELPHCHWLELPENVGRARIRNLLADKAQGKLLLFIDADAVVTDEAFLQRYLDHASEEVVCGGLRHAEVLPSPEVSLRYAYERRADRHRAARYRAKQPYAHFTTFNFMIWTSLFQRIRFDEECREYGHEDTIFGMSLCREWVKVLHIDNPLVHAGLEPNDVFMRKTRAALRNLLRLEAELEGHADLIKAYRLLQRLHMDHCVARWFERHEARLYQRATAPKASLRAFFLYKMGYYCQLHMAKDGK